MSLILEALKKSEQARHTAGPLPVRAAPRQARPSSRRRLGTGLGILMVIVVAVVGIWWSWPAGDGSPERIVEETVQPPARGSALAVPPEPRLEMVEASTSATVDGPVVPQAEIADAVDESADRGGLKEDRMVSDAEDPVAATGPQDSKAGSPETQVESTDPTEPQVTDLSVPEAPMPSPAVEPWAPALPAQEAPRAQADADEAVFDLRGVGRSARAANTEESLPTLDQLPYEIKQRVLPLSLEVHVFDERPARRFVMINGKLISEGGDVKAGLRVDKIAREGAVLVWEGHRFLVKPGG